MKHVLQKRLTELESILGENTQSLDEHKTTQAKAEAEVQQGSLRDIVISNRIDEVKSLLSSIDTEEET
jgi:hypothetical protein